MHSLRYLSILHNFNRILPLKPLWFGDKTPGYKTCKKFVFSHFLGSCIWNHFHSAENFFLLLHDNPNTMVTPSALSFAAAFVDIGFLSYSPTSLAPPSGWTKSCCYWHAPCYPFSASDGGEQVYGACRLGSKLRLHVGCPSVWTRIHPCIVRADPQTPSGLQPAFPFSTLPCHVLLSHSRLIGLLGCWCSGKQLGRLEP